MLKICLKDFLAARWVWLTAGTIVVLFVIQPFGNILMVTLFGAILSFAGLLAVFLLEDRNKTEIFFASLPLNRSTIVKARYLLAAALITTAGLLVFGVVLPLGEAILAMTQVRPATVSSARPEFIALFILLSTLLAVLFLPFQHRFDFGRGTVRFGFTAAGIIAVGAGLERVTGRWVKIPATSFDMGNPTLSVMGPLRILENLHTNLGTPLFLAAAVGLCAILFLLALRLSLAGYARREF